jgi:hypothetical protein
VRATAVGESWFTNAELVAGAQPRIVVPTAFREDYLDGLRMLSHQDQPGVLLKALRYAHAYTSQIPSLTTGAARESLQPTHAFSEPNSADRLLLPSALSRTDPTQPAELEPRLPRARHGGIEL